VVHGDSVAKLLNKIVVAHSTTVLKEMGLISAAPSSSREDEDDDIDYAGALDMVW
jgi:hypothetical protein